MKAYCVQCKQKREMKDPTAVTMKNGKFTTETCANRGDSLRSTM